MIYHTQIPGTWFKFSKSSMNDVQFSDCRQSIFKLMWSVALQDNVFVNVVASIQYRALAEKASDAFYKLSNTRTQIQAYVFDGMRREKAWNDYC